MSTEVKFHDDTTATLKSADELTNREAKQLQRSLRTASTATTKMTTAGYVEGKPETFAAALSALTDDELNDIDLYQRSAVLLRLESWTVQNADGSDRPLPTTADEVDDLPRYIFEPLTIAAADVKLSEDFGPDGAGNPKALTAS